MKIGYTVEGINDRALITGLKERWCPNATLESGHFRGQTHTSRNREIRQICRELNEKNVDIVIFLTDSNDEGWKHVKGKEMSRYPDEYKYKTVFGVCERNVECWLAADKTYIARHFNRLENEFKLDDPKGIVNSMFKSQSKVTRLALFINFIIHAPLHAWLKNSPSFKDFYDQLREQSFRLGCKIENIREAEVKQIT